MKIYIDGLSYKGGGIGRVYETLLEEFAIKGYEIHTAIPWDLKNQFQTEFGKYKNINIYYTRYGHSFTYFKNFLVHSTFIRDLEKTKKVEVFLYPTINLPFYVPSKTIVVIHDLRPFTNWWDMGYIKRLYFKFFLDRAIAKAKKIVTVSNFTKEELIKYNKNVKHKVKVIYPIFKSKFKEYEFLEKRPIVRHNYILYIGMRKPHKNLDGLLRAFKEVKTQLPYYKLVIAGPKENNFDSVNRIINELGLKDSVIEFISPPDNVIVNLYKHAKLFVFPSFIEGFGLPSIEAVNLGCPVVLSDIPIFREIFGDSGIYFNPYDPNDMADKIIGVLSDENIRLNLLEKQKEKIKFFDKELTINEYINLLKEVIET